MEIVNALSLQMLENGFERGNLFITKIGAKTAAHILGRRGVESYIGHKDTANVLSNLLNIDISCERRALRLVKNKTVMVAQLTGGRLPEGCTELPQNCKFEFYLVTLRD